MNITSLPEELFENTKKGEIWKCEVKPKDGEDFGKAVNSTVVVIDFTGPIAINIEITPKNPKTTDDLSVTYEYFDADDDTESGTTYKWYKDTGSGFEDSGITAPIVSSASTAKGERWRCEITPKNEFESGLPVFSDF